MRKKLLETAKNLKIDVFNGGVYGVTQGPRLETAAEIMRMQHDGCDMVGMTGMPEAALAKELQLNYVCCALCVNWAAGLTDSEISMEEIKTVIQNAMISIKLIFEIIYRRFLILQLLNLSDPGKFIYYPAGRISMRMPK